MITRFDILTRTMSLAAMTPDEALDIAHALRLLSKSKAQPASRSVRVRRQLRELGDQHRSEAHALAIVAGYWERAAFAPDDLQPVLYRQARQLFRYSDGLYAGELPNQRDYEPCWKTVATDGYCVLLKEHTRPCAGYVTLEMAKATPAMDMATPAMGVAAE